MNPANDDSKQFALAAMAEAAQTLDAAAEYVRERQVEQLKIDRDWMDVKLTRENVEQFATLFKSASKKLHSAMDRLREL